MFGQLTAFVSRYAFRAFILGVLAIPFLIQATSPSLPIFNLHYNHYALLSFAGLVINIVLLVIMQEFKLRGPESIWLTIYIGLTGIFALGEMLQRMSGTADQAMFWTLLSGAGAQLTAPAAYLFALFYTQPNDSHKDRLSFILIVAVIMVFLQENQLGFFFSLDADKIHLFPWGYNNDVGSAYIANLLWTIGLFATTFTILWRFRRATANATLKRQSGFFLIAIGIPVVGGIITDLILPSLNVTVLPPMATFFSTITASMFIYGMIRYRILRISPALIANSILSTMHESVVIINRQLKVEYMNQEAQKIFGSGHATTRRSLPKLFDDFDAEAFDRGLESLDKLPSIALDKLTITQGDKQLFMRAQVTRLKDESLNEGYLLAISDVTELALTNEALKASERRLVQEKKHVEQKVLERTKELQNVRARLEASINSLNAGYLMIDARGKLVMINESALGILFENVMNAPSQLDVEQVAHQFGSSFRFKQHIQRCLETLQPEVNHELELNGKVLQIFLAPVTPISHEGESALGVVVLIEDITEAKVLERSKEEFFSIASHELRTPLTAIRGNTSLIKEYYQDALKDPSLQEMVEDIHKSSIRLIDIVNDFLDASRLEQGRMQFARETFDVSKLITDVIHELTSTADQKHVTLSYKPAKDSLPSIESDSNRIKQVLYNLVGNGIKFTEKGKVTVEAKVDGNFVRIIVSDTGRGIPEETHKLLFRKFQQAGTSLYTRDTTRGTGLGLYISQLMINQLGGTMRLDKSVAGKGSSFSFTIPLAKVTSKDKPTSHTAASTAKN